MICVCVGVLGEDSEREELWRLHDDVFYLFWEAEGSCSEALNFCEDRNSRIATTSSWDGLFDHDWSFLGEPFYHPANPDHVASEFILNLVNMSNISHYETVFPDT